MKEATLPTARADAEFILRVLVDEHRQRTHFDPEVDPSAVLSFDSTIAEWRSACALLRWRKLGRALNAQWGTDATDDEWRAVLEPARERTLRDVCQFLAQRAQLPQLVPRGYFGAACKAASAFVGIRSVLASEGIDTSRIKPSTELASYISRAPLAFLAFGARTAPGSLPGMRIESHFWVRPPRVSLGKLKTFRDYAECLASGVRR